MATAGRHVRHDWQTFVDWEQKSVRTLCGATTKRHLAGVPGITEQPVVIRVGDKNLSGWCQRCAISADREINRVLVEAELTNDIQERYISALQAVTRAANAYRERMERARQRDLARRDARV